MKGNNLRKHLIIGLFAAISACAPPPVSVNVLQATSGQTIVETINPCGDSPSVTYEEVLLRLSDGRILAHYASGYNQFLVELLPGNYVTTDGSNCHFSITNNGHVNW